MQGIASSVCPHRQQQQEMSAIRVTDAMASSPAGPDSDATALVGTALPDLDFIKPRSLQYTMDHVQQHSNCHDDGMEVDEYSADRGPYGVSSTSGESSGTVVDAGRDSQLGLR